MYLLSQKISPLGNFLDTGGSDRIPLDAKDVFHQSFSEHLDVAEKTRDHLQDSFIHLVETCFHALKSGGKILFFGNGGSAADSQHLATELTVRFRKNRPAIPALALTTDTSALTAIGNDLGFDSIFSRQIEALGQPEDVVLALSTSGQSRNIIVALEKAKDMGITTCAFSGKDGGQLVGLADLLLIIPSDTTACIQEMHIMLGHMLCEALEHKLGFVD